MGDEELGAASEWKHVRKLPPKEVGAPGKREGLPGVTIWTVDSCYIVCGGVLQSFRTGFVCAYGTQVVCRLPELQ